MIRVDKERYWLYAAIDPETNEFPVSSLERPPILVSQMSFSKSCARNTMSKTLSFSSTDLLGSKKHFAAVAPDSNVKHTEIGTPLSISITK